MNMNAYAIPGIPAKNRIKISHMNVENIITTVCSYYGEDRSFVMQRSRKKDVVKARYICMYLIYEKMDLSLKSVGKFFNCNYDHTTVIHGISSIKGQLSLPFETPVKRELEEILTCLNHS